MVGGLALPDEAPTPDAIVFAGSPRAFGMRLVAGREPDPSRPDEIVASRSFAEARGVALGTKFDLLTLTQEQATVPASTPPRPRGSAVRARK